jgi:hypothetical protein
MGREEDSIRLKVLASNLLDKPHDHIVAVLSILFLRQVLDLLFMIAGLPLKNYRAPEDHHFDSTQDSPMFEESLSPLNQSFSSSSSENEDLEEEFSPPITPRVMFPHCIDSSSPLLLIERASKFTLNPPTYLPPTELDHCNIVISLLSASLSLPPTLPAFIPSIEIKNISPSALSALYSDFASISSLFYDLSITIVKLSYISGQAYSSSLLYRIHAPIRARLAKLESEFKNGNRTFDDTTTTSLLRLYNAVVTDVVGFDLTSVLKLLPMETNDIECVLADVDIDGLDPDGKDLWDSICADTNAIHADAVVEDLYLGREKGDRIKMWCGSVAKVLIREGLGVERFIRGNDVVARVWKGYEGLTRVDDVRGVFAEFLSRFGIESGIIVYVTCSYAVGDAADNNDEGKCRAILGR